MKTYYNDILQRIINKYERSSITRDIPKIILLNISKTYPEYYDAFSFSKKEAIDDAIIELLKDDYITAEYNHNQDVTKIFLNMEKLSAIYMTLNRRSRYQCEKECLDYLESIYPFCLHSATSVIQEIINDCLNNFVKELIIRLQASKPVKKYFDVYAIKTLQDLLQIFETLSEQNTEISIRKFSQKNWQDSKYFEKIQHKIIAILKEFTIIYDFTEMSDIEILAMFNLVKMPGVVLLKGALLLRVNDQLIDTRAMNNEIALTTININETEIIEIYNSKIITVENLTSFFDMDVTDAICLYLGGYHNTLRRNLLLKLAASEPTLQFYHFGDIDMGGFQIYLHLKKMTNIDFNLLAMDVSTLKKYKNYTKELTESDRLKLEKLKNNKEIKECVLYMLANNVKLEQEIVSIDS